MQKRRQVKRACVNCQHSCKRCDDDRPCGRCTRLGIGASCQDAERKRLSRPRRHPSEPLSLNVNVSSRANTNAVSATVTSADPSQPLIFHDYSHTLMVSRTRRKRKPERHHTTANLATLADVCAWECEAQHMCSNAGDKVCRCPETCPRCLESRSICSVGLVGIITPPLSPH